MTPISPRNYWGFLVACALAACVSCGADPGPGAETASSLGLPAYAGIDKDLFDDQIDPAAMGLSPARPARRDQILWARSQQADIVGRVRVQTVTVDNRGGDFTYHLGLRFADELLASPKVEGRDFEVTIEPRDPAYGLVRAIDTGLQGKTFVGFVKRFATKDDEIIAHFYLAPDTAEVAQAVQEAVAVSEVSKR